MLNRPNVERLDFFGLIEGQSNVHNDSLRIGQYVTKLKVRVLKIHLFDKLGFVSHKCDLVSLLRSQTNQKSFSKFDCIVKLLNNTWTTLL